jgi:hypothetical protein
MSRRASIKHLDPLGRPAAPPPDGEVLLQRLVGEPPPTPTPQPAPARSRLSGRLLASASILAIALLGVAIALAGQRNDEVAVPEGGPTPGIPILHYVVRETLGGDRPQLMGTTETWRLDDGSRARTLFRLQESAQQPAISTEEVVTESESLSYVPEQSAPGGMRIVRYRASDDFSFIDDPSFVPPQFGAPPVVTKEVGDPRTLRARAEQGADEVTALGDAVVRGISVRQYKVGDCGAKTSTRSIGENSTIVDVAEYQVVSLARDTGFPVQAQVRPCDADDEYGEVRTLDYLKFEELPGTPENLEKLQMSPHPGVPVADGVEIDRQEELDDARDPNSSCEQPCRVPAPTPTPGGVEATPK